MQILPVNRLITAQLTLSIWPRQHICSHKAVAYGFFLQKMSVSIFLSFFWSRSDLNCSLLKSWSTFHESSTLSGHGEATDQAGRWERRFKCVFRVTRGGSLSHLGFSAALYCLNAKQSQLNFTNSFKGSLTLICTDYAVNTL